MGRRRRPDLLLQSSSTEHSQSEVSEDQTTDLYRLSLDETEETDGTGGSSSLRSEMTSDGSVLSYDTMSDASSMMGIDVEQLLGNPSFDAEMGPAVFGWFDYACGWMDRPNLCDGGLGADAMQQSLLRESKLKADKAIRNMKFNDALSQAAQEAISHEFEDDETARDTEDEENDELSAQETDKSESTANQARSSSLHDEEVQAKMKAVSARATEILKNSLVDERSADQDGLDQDNSVDNLSDRPDVPEEEEEQEEKLVEAENLDGKSDSVQNPKVSPSTDGIHAKSVDSIDKTSSYGSMQPQTPKRFTELRKKVIDSLAEAGVGSDDESIDPSPSSTPEVETTRDEESALTTQVITESVVNALAARERRKQSKSLAKGNSLADQQPSSAVPSFDAEDEDIVSTYPTSTAPAKESNEKTDFDIPSEHAVTDLTHVEERNTVRPKVPSYTSARSMSTKRSRLAALKKSVVGKKTVDVIDVLELEDDDSWTPAEKRQPLSSTSESEILRNTDTTTLTAMGRKNMGKNTINAEGVRARIAQTSPSTNLFSDPRAREAFAGLRRGRLETRQAPNEIEYNVDSSSRRDRKIMPEVINDVSVLDPKTRNSPELNLKTTISKDTRQHADVSLELRRQAMSSQQFVEGASSHNWESDSNRAPSIVRTRSLVAVRSIDEAQRERKIKPRGINDLVIHPSKSKEQTAIQYGVLPAGSRENPMDVHTILETRKREQYSGRNPYLMGRSIPSVDRSRSHRRALLEGGVSRSSINREMDHSEVPRSRSYYKREDYRDSQMYNSVINPTKSRESNIDVSGEAVNPLPMGNDYGWMSSSKNLSRDPETRDDPEGSTNHLARSSTAGKPVIKYGESRLLRGEPRMDRERKNFDHLEQLRKLEKKITQRLKEVNSEQKPWDEQSTRSSRHLRKLEHQLAQTLRKEDEKRAARLKRIRDKQQSRRAIQVEDLSSAEFSRSEITKEKTISQATTADESMEVPGARAMTKYSQLMALRQSRPMHKYMHRSSSRSRSRLGVVLPDSY